MRSVAWRMYCDKTVRRNVVFDYLYIVVKRYVVVLCDVCIFVKPYVPVLCMCVCVCVHILWLNGKL